MHTREQNLMRSSLQHRARIITDKQYRYLEMLNIRRAMCGQLRWNSQNPVIRSASDSLRAVEQQIHNAIAIQTPDFKRLRKEMNNLHIEQRDEKNRYRKSMRTPLFETAHQNGISEREVRKIIIDVMRIVDHQPSQAEMARFMSHAISYWNRVDSLKEFVCKALKNNDGNMDQAGKEMTMATIKAVKSYGALERNHQKLGSHESKIEIKPRPGVRPSARGAYRKFVQENQAEHHLAFNQD